MATRTIPRTSDREALEKRMQNSLQRIIDSQDQETIKVAGSVLGTFVRLLRKPGKGGAA